MSVPTSRHSRSTVTASVATIALAAISALGAVPAAATTHASAPISAGTSRGDTVTATRPIPPRIQAELLAAAHRAATRPPVHLAAGFRPVPGTSVSTDLPSRLEIGSLGTGVRFTTSASSTDAYVNPYGVVDLIVGGKFIAGFLVDLSPGQTTFRGTLFFQDGPAAQQLGTGHWVTGIGDNSRGAKIQEATIPVTVKLRSLLGVTITRSGSAITVTGASKTYAGGGAYPATRGQQVHLQRYTSTGWQTFRTVTTDTYGHFTSTTSIPYRASIRAITYDTPTTFGAATTGTVL